MRIHVVAFLLAAALLIVAVLLPSKRDTSVAAWWMRVCLQLNLFARAALALTGVGLLVWYVVLPLLGWRF